MMPMYYYFNKHTLHISRNNAWNDLACQLALPPSVLSVGTTSAPEEFVQYIQNESGVSVDKLVINGDWSEIPPVKSFVISPYNKRGIMIDSDYRYSKIGHRIIPVVRDISQNRDVNFYSRDVLFLLDRPLRFHPDALFIYYLLRNYYNVHLWYSHDDDCLLNCEYEILFHFGHANEFCYKVGDQVLYKLPKARLLFSYGCHSAKAFAHLNPEIAAFCGYSYFCFGQKPGIGSNELINCILTLMVGGRSLSEAVVKAKQWYEIKHRIRLGCHTPKTTEQYEATVNLLSLCTFNDCSITLNRTCGDFNIQIVNTAEQPVLLLPAYDDVLLVIICADSLYEQRFTLLDSNLNEIQWENVEPIRYADSYKSESSYLLSRSSKELWMLFSKCQSIEECIPGSFDVVSFHLS